MRRAVLLWIKPFSPPPMSPKKKIKTAEKNNSKNIYIAETDQTTIINNTINQPMYVRKKLVYYW
jgi:hypothetical protein